MLRAELLQLAVADKVSTDGQVVAPPEGRQWSTQTLNVVVIDGWIPVGSMELEMAKQKDENKRLTPGVQRGVVYRVRVLRRELLPNGSWTKDEEVAPAKGSPAPADLLPKSVTDDELPTRMNEIEGQLQWIQLPNYYVKAAGEPVAPPILKKPVPKAIADEMTKLKSDLEAAKSGGGAGAGRTVALPGTTGMVGTPGTGAPAGGTGEAAPELTVASIAKLNVQPFTFWDDSVKPDHTYKYSVQIQFVNPGFGWRWGLEKPELKTQQVIPVGSEKIVAVPGQPITVHSDIAFFIQGPNFGTAGGVSGRLYRQDNGRWYWTSFSTQNGMNIAAPMSIGGQTVDVDTNFALVDSQTSGNNTHVILKDPSGNLVTRDSVEDWKRPDNDMLWNKVKEGAAAAAATATTESSGTTKPGTPATRSNR
jgi:hypothetical protein